MHTTTTRINPRLPTIMERLIPDNVRPAQDSSLHPSRSLWRVASRARCFATALGPRLGKRPKVLSSRHVPFLQTWVPAGTQCLRLIFYVRPQTTQRLRLRMHLAQDSSLHPQRSLWRVASRARCFATTRGPRFARIVFAPSRSPSSRSPSYLLESCCVMYLHNCLCPKP